MYGPIHNGNERTVVEGATQASAAYAAGERYLTVGELLRIFWKRLWIVVLVVLIAAGIALAFSFRQVPVYEASAKLLVGQKQGDSQQPNLMGSIEGLQQLTRTMVTAVDSRPVAEEVIDRLDLQIPPQTLLENLSAEQIDDTQFLLLSYKSTDPQRAQGIVNAVADVSSARFSESNASAENITVTIWEQATVPATPISPKVLRNVLLAVALGFLLGLGLAILAEVLDDTWRSPEEVEGVSGVPTFGAVPAFGLVKTKNKDGQYEELVSIEDPTSIVSEAYRMVRTNLLYAVVDDPPKVIVLTSAGGSEGKTTTVANLGVALAQAGKSTLIVDCDLRRPRLHTVFGARNKTGLVDILVHGNTIQDVWQEPVPKLKMICAGPPPPNPAEILASQRLAAFLADMKSQFDYVLVDTPPIGFASEAAALAANADGVLLVLDSQSTRKGALRQALNRLHSVGANVLGTVMNKYELPKGSMDAYTHYQS